MDNVPNPRELPKLAPVHPTPQKPNPPQAHPGHPGHKAYYAFPADLKRSKARKLAVWGLACLIFPFIISPLLVVVATSGTHSSESEHAFVTLMSFIVACVTILGFCLLIASPIVKDQARRLEGAKAVEIPKPKPSIFAQRVRKFATSRNLFVLCAVSFALMVIIGLTSQDNETNQLYPFAQGAASLLFNISVGSLIAAIFRLVYERKRRM